MNEIRGHAPLTRQPSAGDVPLAERGVSDTHARSLRAVLFDVDFTLCRPGPRLGPLGYRQAGVLRAASSLTPSATTRPGPRPSKTSTLHPELDYDLEVWQRFTEDIVRGMGGTGDAVARGRRGDRERVGGSRELRALRRRAADPSCGSRARLLAGAHLEHEPRPRRVRRPPRHRRGRRRHVSHARKDEAASRPSSGACWRCSTSRRARRSWSETRSATTSVERRHSECRRYSSTARGPARPMSLRSAGWTSLFRCSAVGGVDLAPETRR